MDWAEFLTLAETAAQHAWDANIATASREGHEGSKVSSSKHVGTAWTATVTYDEKQPTSFASLLGVKSMRLAGMATASTTVEKNPNFWDFHIVIDTSSSMGIGATDADMEAMEAHPDIGCAFACHNGDYSKGQTDSVKTAAKAGIKLRVDIVDEAVDSMIDQLATLVTNKNIRSQLWGLHDTVGSLVDLTTKLNDVKNHKIELYQTLVSVGNTNYEASLDKLTPEVGKAGDGKSSVSPKKAVFIVTDGIHDTNVKTSNVSYVWWSDHQMGTVDPAFCETMKDNGVLVGVLYIDYFPPNQYDRPDVQRDAERAAQPEGLRDGRIVLQCHHTRIDQHGHAGHAEGRHGTRRGPADELSTFRAAVAAAALSSVSRAAWPR